MDGQKRMFKVVSDGTAEGTIVYDPDGNKIGGITTLSITGHAHDNSMGMVLSIYGQALDLEISEEAVRIDKPDLDNMPMGVEYSCEGCGATTEETFSRVPKFLNKGCGGCGGRLKKRGSHA